MSIIITVNDPRFTSDEVRTAKKNMQDTTKQVIKELLKPPYQDFNTNPHFKIKIGGYWY